MESKMKNLQITWFKNGHEKQASPFGLDWEEVKRQLDSAKDDGQMTNAIIWNADNGKSIRVDF